MAQDLPHPSERFGQRYDTFAELRSTADECVYRAESDRSDQPVIVRVFRLAERPADTADTAEPSARLGDATWPSAQTKAEYVVPIETADLADPAVAYLLRRFVAGRTIEQVVATHAPLDERVVTPMLRQCLRGLQQAHQAGVHHGGIKPTNIIVEPIGGEHDHVQLVDFGLTRLRRRNSNDGQSPVSNPRYLAPEQLRSGTGRPASDLFSLGLVTYELLTGQPANSEPNTVGAISRQVDDSTFELPANLQISGPLRAVCDGLLRKDPTERIQRCQTAMDTLDRRADRASPAAGASSSGGSAARPTLQPGDTLMGRYEVTDELGAGGMGVVVKAHDQLLNRDVAIKFLSTNLQGIAEARELFLKEARSMAKLSHDHLVPVHDVTMVDGAPMIVTGFVAGINLQTVMRRQGALAVSTAIDLATQLGGVVDYLHQSGIIHRDLKPDNALLADDGKLTLIDFGLARSLEHLRIRSTEVRGTPAYMAPEQIKGDALSPATDMYQLGVTIFEMVTGRLPFPEGDMSYAHVFEDPPRIDDLIDNVPEGLVELVGQCLAKDPSDRPQNAGAVVSALQSLDPPSPGAREAGPTLTDLPENYSSAAAAPESDPSTDSHGVANGRPEPDADISAPQDNDRLSGRPSSGATVSWTVWAAVVGAILVGAGVAAFWTEAGSPATPTAVSATDASVRPARSPENSPRRAGPPGADGGPAPAQGAHDSSARRGGGADKSSPATSADGGRRSADDRSPTADGPAGAADSLAPAATPASSSEEASDSSSGRPKTTETSGPKTGSPPSRSRPDRPTTKSDGPSRPTAWSSPGTPDHPGPPSEPAEASSSAQNSHDSGAHARTQSDPSDSETDSTDSQADTAGAPTTPPPVDARTQRSPPEDAGPPVPRHVDDSDDQAPGRLPPPSSLGTDQDGSTTGGASDDSREEAPDESSNEEDPENVVPRGF